MKKIISVITLVMILCSAVAPGAFALDSAPNIGDYENNAEGLSQCYSDYMEYYLYGINADTRALIKEYVKVGYTDGSIAASALMPAFANIRKAGQAAEAADNQVSGFKPTVDVIAKYYTLTDEQKVKFESFLFPSLSAIGLTAVITDGKVMIKNGNDDFTQITLIIEKPLSTTRVYLNSYIPGLTEEEKDTIETLVSEYSVNGGTPAGSGAMWRCIREIGELMGVAAQSSIDMEAGTLVITVTKTGEKYLKNCSKDIQNKVIAKAIEGLSEIGCTAMYKNGVFTIKKDNVVRLVHTVLTVTSTPPDQKVSGWKTTGGKTYYYKNGVKVTKTGWLFVNKEYYYLKKGVLQRSKIIKISKKWYITNQKGARVKGTRLYAFKQKTYYLTGKTGLMKRNVKKIKIDKSYYKISHSGVCTKYKKKS